MPISRTQPTAVVTALSLFFLHIHSLILFSVSIYLCSLIIISFAIVDNATFGCILYSPVFLTSFSSYWSNSPMIPLYCLILHFISHFNCNLIYKYFQFLLHQLILVLPLSPFLKPPQSTPCSHWLSHCYVLVHHVLISASYLMCITYSTTMVMVKAGSSELSIHIYYSA
jgi:hypothetical protein